MLFEDQGQIQFKSLEGVVKHVILSQYEYNLLNNNKVIANNIKIQTHFVIN